MSNGIIFEYVIVIRYTPSSKARYIRITGNDIEEIFDASQATTFKRVKHAEYWINANYKYPEFASVESIRFQHLRTFPIG